MTESSKSRPPKQPPAPTKAGLTAVPALMTARQVYELLGLDKRSFYRELAAGNLPRPIRVGASRTRWRADRVLAWMDSLEGPKP